MNYLTAEGLSKAFTETVLFSGISISLQKNQKMALIAANGSGKTTLLKILAGKESPDSGTVSVRNSITIGYLEQDPWLHPDSAIIDTIFDSSNPVLKALGAYETHIDSGDHSNPELLQQLIDEIDQLGAWDYEAKAREVLSRLGLHDLEQKAGTLSGGQKKRVALARLLIEEPDLLLLDEPTNHLDLEMIEWLENYLCSLNKTVLLISHDRYFIDSVCDTIGELDRNKIHIYKGNYAYYLEKKDEREFREGREIDKAQNLMRTELEWMRRQPRARGTKQKARIDSFYELEEKAGSGKVEDKMQITLQMARMGSKILELENVCKSYDNKVLLKDFSHTFKRGEKIGIVGKNGSGKSTLLNMIMGLVKPEAGRIKAGETMVFGYYSQEGMRLPDDKRVIEVVKDIAEYVETGNGNWIAVGQFLNHFQFKGSKQFTYVSKLSGGEKRRLYLLTILLKNPNFLILDEPTNDLDIVTLNLLEDFLQNYQGCMLLVTHDRYFMDRLVDHIFVLEGEGKVKDINGNYTAYREDLKDALKLKQDAERQEKAVAKIEKTNKKVKLTYAEQKELSKLETEIAQLEAKRKTIELLLSDGAADPSAIAEASKQFGITNSLIDEKSMRWLELSEKA
ncbi:MAG: ABC-F family ATP-binding cassette domain-containing protein [Bacteroidetes bacterium]|nr:ABC-F family ATP-binding cassette domain-containing protein [Bacteroidota bacterium]MBL0072228.1 ABC-F family ATP-binding cassette domain-containing protein [Bacteroidota bacterium]